MIGIIGAMQEEIDLLHAQMNDRVEMNRSGIVFYSGSLNEKPVVLCKSGVGKVNAAAYTQVLIDRFNVNQVIFTGVAGAVDPDLNIGDIVISSSSLQHDVDVTALGFARGVIPFQETSEWKADEKLVAAAKQAGENTLPGRVKLGKVLSGDQFIADREQVKELYETFGGACTEMEGAAVAQVCAMNNVPFVIIRSMSDKADGSASVNFAEFTVEASNHSYRIVNEMLKLL
ncbi:5'-methylthioadenosine/adenosylhomocysteine nucleosidase [Cohnella thailandensis]|uniref:adenosylhomocysteine nucleosidase n=1 Tax=Cohnella thailandensis TaxID=557557 RepID=A0A841SVV5_9BACL|nr:5'-methylthioadenosine/adenosylhomocysteine nucleosidase [Cohnella thailandensis]MBB6636423.1 5'-methylthioadenosine/adenosylhomocysteine nucleosidase [Cohnella thailandensis]MBP1973606.1 adenosylhomocysteine nucleosidase [Cohnella thailandensis]